MTRRERALARGSDVIAGTLGSSVKREAKATRGADEVVRARVVQAGAPRPRMVRAGTPGPRVAQAAVPEPRVVWVGAPKPRVAIAGTPEPRVARRQAPKYLQ
jgi:hypothetical protein